MVYIIYVPNNMKSVTLEDTFVCPFCDASRKSKIQIDFHLKYGHADVYPLMSKGVNKVDLEAKLIRLIEKKKELEDDIEHIKTIIGMKPKVE